MKQTYSKLLSMTGKWKQNPILQLYGSENIPMKKHLQLLLKTHTHKYSIKVSTVVLLLLKSKDRAELS